MICVPGSSVQSVESRDSGVREICLPQKKSAVSKRQGVGGGGSGALTVVEVDRRRSSSAADDDDDDDDDVDNDADDASSTDSNSNIDTGTCCSEVGLAFF